MAEHDIDIVYLKHQRNSSFAFLELYSDFVEINWFQVKEILSFLIAHFISRLVEINQKSVDFLLRLLCHKFITTNQILLEIIQRLIKWTIFG